MPENFPGVHGCPATQLPSFVVTEGVPADLHHMVTLSRALGMAIDAATQLPGATTPEVVADHFRRIEVAKTILRNTITTIENIEAWSRRNLEPARKQAATSHGSGHPHPPSKSRG